MIKKEYLCINTLFQTFEKGEFYFFRKTNIINMSYFCLQKSKYISTECFNKHFISRKVFDRNQILNKLLDS